MTGQVLSRALKQSAGKALARLFLVPLLLAGVSVFSAPAVAQDLQALLDRIERLERDIRTLNTQIARGEGAVVGTGEDSNLTPTTSSLPSYGVARIDARIASLENDVRSATSAVENLDHLIYEMSSKLDKLVSDVDFRLSELGRGQVIVGQNSVGQGTGISTQVGAATGETVPQVSSVPPTGEVTQVVSQSESGVLGTITETQLQQISNLSNSDQNTAQQTVDQQQTTSVTSVLSQSQTTAAQTSATQTTSVETAAVAPSEATIEQELSPQDQYTQAFGLLRQAKYDDATIALQTFVDQHPNDTLAPNARYWLGETYYVRSEFVRSAEIFFEGYRAMPNGPKAPDTLLKLGMSLGNLGKNAEACAAFAKLASDFVDLSANVRNTLDRERLRNGCS